MSLSRLDLPDWLDVSRETIDKLQKFQSLVEKWNRAINLIAKNGQAEIWHRHILDSAQLIYAVPQDAKSLCDLGSGGGFPGIVIAVIAQSSLPELRVTLVESDKRKSVFLSQAVRDLGLNVTVKMSRIEDLFPEAADVVSARALSPLVDLLHLSVRHLKAGGTGIFPKGAAADLELALARREWVFNLEERASKTSEEAKILILKDIVHV